jgi:hypothetical protein
MGENLGAGWQVLRDHNVGALPDDDGTIPPVADYKNFV